MANLDNNPMSKENADSLIATALRYKKKLPPGRWKTFDVSTNENIPKQIFEQNHSAWIVYALALAQVNSTHKFTQKDDCRQFLKTIDNSNLDTFVKLVDERIRHLDPKEQGRIQKFCEQAERRRKKRRLEDASEEPDFRDDVSCDEGDEGEDDEDDERSTPSTSPECHQQTNAQAHSEMAWTLFRNADLEAAVSLFPQFLADAIERRFHPSTTDVMVAAIDMQTPGGYDLYSQGCTMLINITGSAVFRLARDLFDVYVEQDAVGVYIAYGGGAKLRPEPSLKLEGGRIDAISTFFGEKTSRAIQSSGPFQEDLRRRHSKTIAVTMCIDTLQGTSGRLFLSLSVIEGGEIRSQLYT